MYRKCWHCDRDVRVKEKIVEGKVEEILVIHFRFGERCPASMTRPTDGEA